jgi:hypothetical protein
MGMRIAPGSGHIGGPQRHATRTKVSANGVEKPVTRVSELAACEKQLLTAAAFDAVIDEERK